MNYRILVATLFVLLTSQACEQLILEAEPKNTARANFEYLWQEAKENYAFFEYKSIDWDDIYQKYSPLVTEETGQIELFNILFDMLNELRDGHVNLISPFNVSRFNVDLLGPENIDWRLIREHYLSENYYRTGPLQHDFLADGRVGYVRYESFSSFVSNFDMDFIFLRYEKTEGLIIDLRQNGGGSLSNTFRILNRFAKEKTLIYNSYLKSGPGPDDFSSPQAAYVEPVEDRLTYDNNVIVLIDRGTYSAASFFALGARALPNLSLMGDFSGGGLGIPNGGQIPNGWTYRFSISQTITPDGQNYESGVPPDEFVIMSDLDRLQNRDPVIDRAIEKLTQ
jgi:hypothetical protein